MLHVGIKPLKGGQSEVRCAVGVKHVLDFKDVVRKKKKGRYLIHTFVY